MADVVAWVAGPWHKLGDPQPAGRAVLESARGQRRSTQIGLCCEQPLEAVGITIEGAAGEAVWRIYRVAEVGTSQHGAQPDALLPWFATNDLSSGSHAVWLTAVCDCAGIHEGTILIRSGGEVVATLPVRLEVDDLLLPARRSGYLDLWQQPTAVADSLGLERWSEAHLHALRPYLEELAAAGQKPITCTILDEPWGHQTHYDFPSMVDWRRTAEGWAWDFAVFDRWVELALHCGLPGPISCYSMVLGPGDRADCTFPNSAGQPVACAVGDAVYEATWTAFLRAFREHLDRRGWLPITQIGFDEKPGGLMEQSIGLLRRVAPEFGVALAGNWIPELDALVDDYCVIHPGPPRASALARRDAGRVTTFYTCCGPAFPNTFVHSPPIEATLLGWIAAAGGCDGYLRWAYASWPEASLESADYGNWPAGDTFLIHRGPSGPVSTQRWEMLREGLDDYELARWAERLVGFDPIEPYLTAVVAEQDGRKASPEAILAARRALRRLVAEKEHGR